MHSSSNDDSHQSTPVGAETTLRAHIQKRLGPVSNPSLLLDIDFTALPGITILFGSSGAGKTTLLDCLAGLLSPDSGQISLHDRVLFDNVRQINVRAAERRIGYVFQDLGLFPHITVEQNVQYGLARLPYFERQRRAALILEAFHITARAGRYPAELSGGERQRVALARSLVTDPSLLLLDEPLSALDASIKARIIDDLREWNRLHGIPILYVTHSREEVFALGERILVLERGKLLAQGTPQEVLQSPRHETVAQLAGFENIFDAEAVSIDEKLGTMTLQLCDRDVCLEVPWARVEPGTKMRIGVRAGDILLAADEPKSLSARNILAGRIVSLAQRNFALDALVDCGVLFHVHLTLGARDALHFAPGSAVWVIIKSHSCCLLHPGGESPC
jgi:molybdate transport system ATP-binding protein